MPIKIQNDLPAREILEKENIFVVEENRALHQDIRPLQICILNLMPLKEDTELQLLRALSNTPLQIDVSFMRVSSHLALNTSPNHLNRFYNTWDELKDNTYDGMIITGAPVEQLSFEEVDYWDELCRIFEWTKTNVTSTFHICWGAQAGLYYHYGVPKYDVAPKVFGVYKHHLLVEHEKLFRGFDDEFYVPHSRHTEIHKADIEKVEELTILAEAEGDAGVYAIANLAKRQFFITGHAEYDPMSLKSEYDRDKKAGLDIRIPINYYPDDDPTRVPVVRWRSVANLLFANWLNYYVYQETPYELDGLYSDADD